MFITYAIKINMSTEQCACFNLFNKLIQWRTEGAIISGRYFERGWQSAMGTGKEGKSR